MDTPEVIGMKKHGVKFKVCKKCGKVILDAKENKPQRNGKKARRLHQR